MRSKIVDAILQMQFVKLASNPVKFVQLPNVCIGHTQPPERLMFDSECASLILYQRKESQEFINLLSTQNSFDIYGSVGIGKSCIVYEMASTHRADRDKYRVIYVNMATPSFFISDCYMSLVSVLYDDAEAEALWVLKKGFDQEGQLIQGIKQLKNNFTKCVNKLTNKYNKKVVCYIDQINELYNNTTQNELDENKSWLGMLRETIILVTCGSARNEYTLEKEARRVGVQHRPPVQIDLTEMKYLLVNKYKLDIAQISDEQLDHCYYLTNGIFLEIHSMFSSARSPLDLASLIKAYDTDFDRRFKSNSHSTWLEKIESEKVCPMFFFSF
jgi:hypothetical protein